MAYLNSDAAFELAVHLFCGERQKGVIISESGIIFMNTCSSDEAKELMKKGRDAMISEKGKDFNYIPFSGN